MNEKDIKHATDIKYHCMGTWKAERIRKRSKGSQTPGHMKGESCQADGFKRSMAKRNRSYKHPEYSKWCAMIDAINRKTVK